MVLMFVTTASDTWFLTKVACAVAAVVAEVLLRAAYGSVSL